jgi:UDP-glucose 4-epimerase
MPTSPPRSGSSSRTRVDLPAGRSPGSGPDLYLDITRLRQDTGYQPVYDTDRAVADYLAWLRVGHDR